MTTPALGPNSPVAISGLANFDGRAAIVMLTATLAVEIGDYDVGGTWAIYARAISVGTDGSIGTQGAWVSVGADGFWGVRLAVLDSTRAVAVYSPDTHSAYAVVLTADPASLAVTVGTAVTFESSPYVSTPGPDGMYQRLGAERDWPFALTAPSSTQAIVGYHYEHAVTSGFLDTPGPANGRKIEHRVCLLDITGTTITAHAPVTVTGPSWASRAVGPTSGVNPSGATVTPSNDGNTSWLSGGTQWYFVNVGDGFWAGAVTLSPTQVAYLFQPPCSNLEADGFGSLYAAILNISGSTVTVGNIWRVSKGRLYFTAGTHVNATRDGVDNTQLMAFAAVNGHLVSAYTTFPVNQVGTAVVPFTGAESSFPAASNVAVHVTVMDPATGAITDDITFLGTNGGVPLIAATSGSQGLIGVWMYAPTTEISQATWRYFTVDGTGTITLDAPLDVISVESSDFYYAQVAGNGSAAAIVQDHWGGDITDPNGVYYTVGNWTPAPPPTVTIGRVGVQFVL